MPFTYRELCCGRNTFCCCIPVRIGVIILSFLGFLLAGSLSVVLWYEFSVTTDMDKGERVGFVLAAIVETILFVVSVLGFVGAVVRKQSFVQVYAYFIYVHLFLNIAVAAFFLTSISRFSNKINDKVCQDAIINPEAQDQCTGLLRVARWVYFAIAAVVLFVEIYTALIISRYLHQLKKEKRTARAMQESESAFGLVSGSKGRYASVRGGQNVQVYGHGGFGSDEFDPYELATRSNGDSRRYEEDRYDAPELLSGPSPGNPNRAAGGQTSEEVGYGGGLWTHGQISDEEKARLEAEEAISGRSRTEEERLPRYA